MQVYDMRIIGYDENGWLSDKDVEFLTTNYVETKLSPQSIDLYHQSLKDGNRLCEAFHEAVIHELCYPPW